MSLASTGGVAKSGWNGSSPSVSCIVLTTCPGVRRERGRDLAVEVVLPVHALGDGLDDEIAISQELEIVVVVRGHDVLRVVLVAERRGVQLLQVLDRAQHDAALGSLFRSEVEED